MGILVKIKGILKEFHHRFINLPVKKNKDAIKWGIVGTGQMGMTFGSALAKSKDNIAYAVYSRSESNATLFRKRFHTKKEYVDYSEFLKDPVIDVVYIATPVGIHFDFIRRALEAGKNVLCEKPIVNSVIELQELIDLAKSNDCFLMEGMWSRLLPTFIQAKEWIEAGKIGDIELIRAGKYRKKRYKSESRRKSVLWEYGVYPVWFVKTFLPEAKISSFENLNSQSGLITDWRITLKQADKIGIAEGSSLIAVPGRAIIKGTKGSIIFNAEFNRTNCVTLLDLLGNEIERKEFKYQNEGFEYEIEEVNRCLRAGKKESKTVSLADSLSCLKLMEEIGKGI